MYRHINNSCTKKKYENLNEDASREKGITIGE